MSATIPDSHIDLITGPVFAVLTTIAEAWGPVALGSPAAWSMIAGFAALQLALMRLLPGATVYGPPTPTGHVPVYKANGVASFLVTLGLFGGGAWLGWFSPAAIHDHFGELLGALNEYVINLRQSGTWNRLAVKYFGPAAPEILRRSRE